MNIEVWQCACGMHHERPWMTCFRCNPEGHRTEAAVFREASVEARLLDIDPYSDGILARTEAGIIVRVRDVGLALRLGGTRSREELVTKAQLLADENKELLVENAKLRRSLERAMANVPHTKKGTDR